MSQNFNDDLSQNDLFEPDEEIEEELEWEEELERQYGGDEEEEPLKGKIVGSGFSKQKKVMEANRYYQGRKKRIKISGQTKK